MEFQKIEIGHLIDNPSAQLERAFDGFMEAVERGVEAAVETACEIGVHVVEQGAEIAQEFMSNALDELREAGFFEALTGLTEEAIEIGRLLRSGLESIMELPPEQLVQVVALTALAVFAPELLLANPKLVASALHVANTLLAL